MSETNDKSIAMVRTLGGVAALSGLLIVLAVELTMPMIKANKAEVLRKAIFEVLPEISRFTTFIPDPTYGIAPLRDENSKVEKIYAGFNDKDELKSIAVEASGQGFADIIRVLYGYDPVGQTIIGFKVLESKETPGLGDKIEKDRDFLNNFKALDLKIDSENQKLLHPVTVVKKGKKNQPWQIDAITGATISSKAIGKMLDRSTSTVIPLIKQNIHRLKGEE